jgi:hypothetical protein
MKEAERKRKREREKEEGGGGGGGWGALRDLGSLFWKADRVLTVSNLLV